MYFLGLQMAHKCKINGETLTLAFACIGQIFWPYYFEMVSPVPECFILHNKILLVHCWRKRNYVLRFLLHDVPSSTVTQRYREWIIWSLVHHLNPPHSHLEMQSGCYFVSNCTLLGYPLHLTEYIVSSITNKKKVLAIGTIFLTC